MRIPTVVVVNDKNPDLDTLIKELQLMVRVYVRDSVQGEQLYGIREGVIYFDDRGDKQMIHQDMYSDTLRQVQTRLSVIAPQARAMLDSFLKQQG